MDIAAGVFVVAALAAATAFTLDARTPHRLPILFAIPILIAADRWPPRIVGVTVGAAIGLDVASAMAVGVPLGAWAVGFAALLVIGYLAVTLVHHRAEAARRVGEAAEAREQMLRFMGMVAHELGGPLTSVLGFTQLLLRRSVGRPAEVRALATMERHAHAMRRLVDDLRSAAHIGSGRFGIQAAPMDLVAAVEQVAEQCRSGTPTHGIAVDAPERLDGAWDRGRIVQLLSNILSNSLKYSPPGSTVRLTVRHLDADALITVADQGIGIAAEQMPRLFQPFSRVDTGQVASGTGLGLYIARVIAESHGGRIWVESEPGQGSTFFVALPLVPVDASSSAGEESRRDDERASPPPAEGDSRLFLVDP